MNRKKLYIIIVILLIVFLVFIYFFTRGGLGFNANQSIKDTTKVAYDEDKKGCLKLVSGTEGAKASISSTENSFSEIVELPTTSCVPVGNYLVSIYANNHRSNQRDVFVGSGEEILISVDLKFIGRTQDEEKISFPENF